MVLPGPEAQQLATYIGWLMHRTWGGVVAGALFVLPSLVILIALSWLYMAYGHVPAIAGILYGIKPAVVAIVLHAAWRIGSRALRRPILWVIAALAFVAIFAFSAPFPAIVLVAGVIGYIGGRVAPNEFAVGGGHGSGGIAHLPAVIDDDTPTPSHALFRWSRLAIVDRRVRDLVGARALRARICVRSRHAAAADRGVLQQGCVADVWRRLRRACPMSIRARWRPTGG
jgi:chromate transporter